MRLDFWKSEKKASSNPKELKDDMDIAIIGMACRLPGAKNYEEFWMNIKAGISSVTETPKERWDWREYCDVPQLARNINQWGTYIEDAGAFDARFFELSNREVEIMDPQQRIMLELAWSCLEDAGVRPSDISGKEIGVFCGAFNFDFKELLDHAQETIDSYTVLGTSAALIPNRISYFFNLKGPSLEINTACSATHLAIHTACCSLLNDECEMAMAGGISLSLSPVRQAAVTQLGILSQTGSCKTFDAKADGYVRGEGAGIFLLKKLSKALEDGDPVHGIIKGSAVNHGGKMHTLTYPNAEAQAEVIRKAIKRAKVHPQSISYVEAHGTGTQKGDPIEFEGLKKAFDSFENDDKMQRKNYCGIGSAKTNVGHLEPAAGVPGMIKVLLSMKYKILPGLLNFDQLNPAISIEDSSFYMVKHLQEWHPLKKEGKCLPRRAGISSFGFGGANGHIILEEAPERKRIYSCETMYYIICLSAKTREALRKRITDLKIWLEGSGQNYKLGEISSTLLIGREHFSERIAFAADTIASLKEAMDHLNSSETKKPACTMDQSQIKQLLNEISTSNDRSNLNYREKLMSLAELYMEGEDFDWKDIFPFIGAKINMPVYPFMKDYFALPKCKNMLGQTNKALEQLPPILDALKNVSIPKWEIYQTKLNDNHNSIDGTKLLISGNMELKEQFNLFCGPERTWELQDKHYTQTEIEKMLSGYGRIDYLVWTVPESREASFLTNNIVLDQDNGIYFLFRLIKALLKLGYENKKLDVTILTLHCQAVLEREKPNPAHAGVHGLAAVMAKEFPNWKAHLFDLDRTHDLPLSDMLSMYDHMEGSINALRGDNWYRQQLIPLKMTDNQKKNQKSTCRLNGVYVVIGGAGGIGELWSEYMIRTYHAKIIWIGRREKNAEIEEKINRLGKIGYAPHYISADATISESVENAYEQIKKEFPVIHGIVHSAVGELDRSIRNMNEEQFCSVAKVKIDASVWLAGVFQKEPLDFILFFSSMMSFLKVPGQSGYVTGSVFMDAYADRLSKELSCRVKTINWGDWGRIGIGKNMPDSSKVRLAVMGLEEIEAENAMKSLDTMMCTPFSQMAYVKMKDQEATGCEAQSGQITEPAENTWMEKTIVFLKELVSRIFKIPYQKLNAGIPLEQYGLDSILIVHLTKELEKEYEGVSSTLFFEYRTINELADYLVRNSKRTVIDNLDVLHDGEEPKRTDHMPFLQNNACHTAAGQEDDTEQSKTMPIAVIGMSGRYPKSDNVESFWNNLKNGTDCITEIPEDRWSMEEFYVNNIREAIEQRKSYCKWGGFIDGFAEFDPHFFKISPNEAMGMDPQERLILQECWRSFEDAGYTKQKIARKHKGNVGVFIGITKTGFEWYGPILQEQGNDIRPNTSFASAASRVSYVFDLHGPSMPIDTMCSSSLTAVHEACEHIRNRECEIAVVGGVNIYSHPSSYIQLCKLMMLSKTGKCHSFGMEADGFVPGEGAGAIILKPLSEAIKDRDQIYGIIKGSAVNHGGKSNGYTVPNVKAQRDVICRAMDKADINARTVSYIEAHGTGTALGDPVEIAGLTQAFQRDTADTAFCAVGSAKTNIGHLEGAAGIAGLMKVLLQMKYKQLVPSLHAGKLNEKIDFSAGPFFVQQSLSEWKRPRVKISGEEKEYPRIAGVSAFGASGVNAHVVVEEYCHPEADEY